MNQSKPENTLAHAQRLELFDSCYPLALSLAKRYDNVVYKHSEDIRQEAAMALWKACLKCKFGEASWDEWKKQFVRYAYRVVVNRMKDMYVSYVHGKSWTREFTIRDEHDGEDMECGIIELMTAIPEDAGLRQLEAVDEWHAFLGTVNAKQKKAFEMVYIKHMTQKQVAKKLKCSHQICNVMPQLINRYKRMKYRDECQ